MEELISVIIPVYNVENYIEKCIYSVINQSYKNLEIILVDDGSTDKSGVLCDKYEKIDKRIKVIHKENGGLSSARNMGLDCANGEYIMFLDSDDFVETTILQELYSLCYKNNVEISICNYKYINNDKEEANDKEENAEYIYDNIEKFHKMFFEGKFFWMAWGKLYKRRVFNNFRFKENQIYEDFYLIPRIILNTSKVAYTTKSLYYYTIREESIMGKSKYKINKDLIYIINENVDYFKKQCKINEQKKVCILGIILHGFQKRCVIQLKDEKVNQEFIKAYRKIYKKYILYILFNRKLSLKLRLKMCLYSFC
ncbi:MAG: glycosyltransferase family 2 protein [Clostridium sp.]